MNYTIGKVKLQEEEKILKDIFDKIDSFSSFSFDTGAGAGKTYSLIKAITYALDKNSKILKSNKQKILCITYTNVAAEELKQRIGYTELVEISTIHEFLNKIFMGYQADLIDIFYEHLANEIQKEEEIIKNIKWRKSYIIGDDSTNFNKEKLALLNYISDIVTLDCCIKRDVIIDKIKNDLSYLKLIPSNKKNFEKFVTKSLNIIIYKNIKLTRNIRRIKYQPSFNQDNLKYGYISHDSLINYSFKLIEKFEIYRQILGDSYPIILIDEYQDTHEEVIKILKLTQQYFESYESKFLVGYFGDKNQAIYDDGVGDELDKIYEDKTNGTSLVNIKKSFNRRSSQNIISLANKVRNDSIEQVSIFDDFYGREVEFFRGNFELILSHVKDDWGISESNPLDCLILKKEIIAEKYGFEELYNFYNSSIDYFYYDKDILFNLEKMNNLSRILVDIIEKYIMLSQEKEFLISRVFDAKIFNDLDLDILKPALLDCLNYYSKIDKTITLQSYLDKLYRYTSESNYCNHIGKYLFPIDIKGNHIDSIEQLKKTFENDLRPSKSLDDLLRIPIKTLISWYNYLNNTRSAVNYHTFHGTKGKEFNNVIVVLEDSFNNKQLIDLFKYLNGKIELSEEIKSLKNLLYVALTRAKNILSVVYSGTDTDFIREIEEAFDIKFKNI